MVEVECPRCGCRFHVRGRAKVGEGTRRGKSLKRLSRNHVQLIHIVRKNPMKTVREIQKLLFVAKNGKPLLYTCRDGSTKFWNYHEVQVSLSILVGANLVSMTEPYEERFDLKTGTFEVKPAPRYYVSAEQFRRFSMLMKRQMGVIPA